MFQFTAEGAIVEVSFSDGRPDKPMVRQTLQDGQTLPAIRPGEQLQQQRAGVSQRITREGSWQRETDQEIEQRKQGGGKRQREPAGNHAHHNDKRQRLAHHSGLGHADGRRRYAAL